MNFLNFSKQFFLTIILFFFFFVKGSFAVNDPRYASVKCSLIKNKNEIECDYRFSSSLDIINISAKIGGQSVLIPKESITSYPSTDQSTAILFLIDSSDPTRRNTVEKRIVGDIFEMITSFGSPRKSHLKIGLATFDTDLKVISPIGNDEANTFNALSKVKAEGQATEFYKSILDAVTLLSKIEATRKGLIIFSDGKDEDRAYKNEDVLKAAKAADVVILGIGYAEKPIDIPFLQNLKRLSEETFGQFYDASKKQSIEQLLKNPLNFIEQGGRVILNTSSFYGKKVISFELGLKNGQTIEINTEVELPDTRTITKRVIDFLFAYWLYLFLGVVVLGILSFLVLKKMKQSKSLIIEYGYLTEPNGNGSKYIINKTAVRIGRSNDNDINLLNDSISLHHAEIHRRRDGTFYIVDLGSTNGIYVNSKKISQGEINSGDEIELGEVRLNFYLN